MATATSEVVVVSGSIESPEKIENCLTLHSVVLLNEFADVY